MRIYTWLTTLTLGFCSIVLADLAPKTVNVGLSKAYIPAGFDDNDRVQFVVEGSFHNTCYKVGPWAFRLDAQNKQIIVQQQAYVYPGICLQMVVPFHQTIDLGLVQQGSYAIVDAATHTKLGSIAINHTNNPEPDDYLYAPMSDAYVITDKDTGEHTLAIVGSFSDRCTDFDEIRVGYNDQVIVVQPIVKHTENRFCEKIKTRFLKTVPLNKALTGMHLLHVRSMNGQAINKMLDLP